jgi:predicted membrane channel-forming protein YqfA (hemolysin III family)
MVVIAMAIRTVELGRLPEQAFVVVALVFLGVGIFGIRLLAMFVVWRKRRKRNRRIAALTESDEL